MASALKVDEIKNPSTGATVINTTSTLEIDCFYLNTDIDNSASSVVVHQWSRDDHSANGISIGNFPTGTGLTGPSGSGDSVNCFSFPKPGYYRLDLTWYHYSGNDNPETLLELFVSVDNGSNYTAIGAVTSGHNYPNINIPGYHVVNGTYFLNVPSVSGSDAVKFRIVRKRNLSDSSRVDQVTGTANTATTPLKSYLISERISEAIIS